MISFWFCKFCVKFLCNNVEVHVIEAVIRQTIKFHRYLITRITSRLLMQSSRIVHSCTYTCMICIIFVSYSVLISSFSPNLACHAYFIWLEDFIQAIKTSTHSYSYCKYWYWCVCPAHTSTHVIQTPGWKSMKLCTFIRQYEMTWET